MKCKQNICGWF